MEENHIVSEIDNEGVYLTDIILDQKIVTKVKSKGKLDIKETEGINEGILKGLFRKNILYFGIMQGEQPVTIEQLFIKA